MCACRCVPATLMPRSPFTPPVTRVQLSQAGVGIADASAPLTCAAMGRLIQDWFGWGVDIPTPMLDDAFVVAEREGTLESVLTGLAGDNGITLEFDSTDGIVTFR